LFQQIRAFGEYGFPESHAASFALLVYISAWLKHHYPAAFAAALINSQPMGFYAPAQLIRDARNHGVEAWPADVNHSQWDCTLEKAQGEDAQGKEGVRAGVASGLRLGLRMIDGLSEAAARIIECAREEGPFISIDSFARRTGFGQPVIKRLAQADAFRSFEVNRSQALWQSLAQEKQPRRMPLFSDGEEIESLPTALPAMQLDEEVLADYRSASLSLRAHPISFHRRELEAREIIPAKKLTELENGVPVCVAGLVIGRQRPGTAKGITFVTLEDETGTINLVVHQRTWNRCHRIARRAASLIAHGQLQTTKPKPVPPGSLEEGEPQLEDRHNPNSQEHVTSVIHVVVRHLEVLAEKFNELGIKSRDFR
jgi:error-prone DNA polymerase